MSEPIEVPTGDDLNIITDWDEPRRRYSCSVTVGADFAIGLSGSRALGYALEVIRVSQVAEYEGELLKLYLQEGAVRDLAGGDVTAAEAAVGMIAMAMRRNYGMRPETRPRPEATAPLKFGAIVAESVREGRVTVELNGRQVGMMTPHQARDHGLAVIECLVSAGLDTLHLNTLVDVVQVSQENARYAIAALYAQRNMIIPAGPGAAADG